MKLFDLHVHTCGVSKCSRLTPEELCAALAEEKCGGFALTNHFAPWHVDLPYEDWLKKYENEYLYTKELAKSRGLTVLFGVEVTLRCTDGVRKDFLMYGVKPSCLFESGRPLWEFSLKELYEYTHAHGGVLIHAHPLRGDSTFEDPRYLDGVEVNCHPLYMDNQKEEILSFAAQNGLIVTCGSDYHGDVYKAHCGVWLPDDLTSEEELGAYLRKGQPDLLIHDIDKELSLASNIHRKAKRARELEELLAGARFPEDARTALQKDYRTLIDDVASFLTMERRRRDYAEGTSFSYREAMDELRASAEKVGVHPYTADLLFYLHLAPALKRFYEERGLPAEFFSGVTDDFRCKAIECHTVYGIWGSFVAWWFTRFFDFSLYGIGRLEYCLIPCPFDYEKNGLRIKKGQTCIDVHIPSKGKLDRAELYRSYQSAARFFAPRLDAPVVFHCESWLLFSEHAAMLPPDSGIARFAADYDLMADAPDEGDLWRIFGAGDTAAPETLPEDTALRRAYKKRLIENKPVHGGIGLFFFELYPPPEENNKE